MQPDIKPIAEALCHRIARAIGIQPEFRKIPQTRKMRTYRIIDYNFDKIILQYTIKFQKDGE